LVGMSKPKPKRDRKPDPNSKRSKGVDRHTKPRLVFHLDTELLEALERHISKSRIDLKVSAVLRLAVRQYLESVGEWPPAAPNK